MTNSVKNRWFSRVFNFEGPLYCPRCGTPFLVGPIFDHDRRVCLTCNTSLIEWNMLSVAYLIDVERAPEIVKTLINYLEFLSDTEASNQLITLLQFFHVEEIISLYGDGAGNKDKN